MNYLDNEVKKKNQKTVKQLEDNTEEKNEMILDMAKTFQIEHHRDDQ